MTLFQAFFIKIKNDNKAGVATSPRRCSGSFMLGNLLKYCTDLSQLLDVFRMLFDANQVGVTIVRADGVIVYYNDAQARLDGLSPKDALGKKICDVYHFTPEDSPTMRALRSGKPVFDSVHYYRTRHGKLVNSANAIYPLWANGALLGGVCFIQSYTAIGKQAGYTHGASDSGMLAQAPAQAQKTEKSHYTFSSLVGESSLLREAAELAKKVAQNASSVMLVGETGVGKEIFAQAIHYESPRRDRPYLALNCSAVPETLMEGILFGTARGAFTGAVNRPGLFEAANNGTLYLDEVDSMPLSLQSKLLRVLQERKVRRIGEGHERAIDVRLISSVGGPPLALVDTGQMRQDFYYRLSVVKVLIPPLRSRMEDLHLLVRHFLEKHSRSDGAPVPLVTPEAMAVFYSHAWPGNVRELEHTIEASLALVDPGDNLEPWHLYRAAPDLSPVPQPAEATTPWLAFQESFLARQEYGMPVGARVGGLQARRPEQGPEENAALSAARVTRLKQALGQADAGRSGILSLSASTMAVEESSIAKALRASAGNIAMAARLLGISPQLMHYKMKKYGLNKRDFLPGQL